MDPASIPLIRAFNRTAAERIGVLTDQFLGRARPLGETRALWEIGPGGLEVRVLRARLALDSGYASRVLRALERQGLVAVAASPDDKRVRCARLTEAGLAEYAEINRLSDGVAESFLAPLNERQRVRLVAAMTEVERLLRASMVVLEVEHPATPDAQRGLTRYFAELNERFETGFDAAEALEAAQHDLAPPAGMLLVARLRGEPIGCGGLILYPDAPLIKRMWVAPEARGLGLGRRLLGELERLAREAGARVIRLDTNRVLAEAITLYRSAGYQEVPRFSDERYAHHWFEKAL
ncbi:MAG TPA: MarR family winged helix-turn-helix transcriptional regulator [Acetobacteraceae bacterium]|nr:MarR family winged helix-turn-helix transcriptional regulator [Acetobacteraceae bacterium]